MKNLTWQNPEQLFVAQELINKVKSKCCGIKVYEVHQAYVDGGLYAMNLINALHSLGIGTIPLSVAFGYDKLDNLSQFDIPRNEIPIVIIGAGYILDNFNVAVSSRKSINRTNKYH